MIARIRKSIEEKDQGFTLIELLVVMIIIGILAAIAIPVFLNQRKSAVDASMKSDLRTAATAVETNFVDKQAYPADNAAFLALNATKDPQTTIAYTLDSGATGFCLIASRASAAQPGTQAWAYDSDKGGLQPSGTSVCS
ncbi:prepilin-type N-terminal cleavage/methylation domain-containing protein [Actinotalea sp. C106]|uniref:type II secretion system protein n=1 Tax=Actinotalea sp. C106 TaxID=2908644 RepID=UPI002029061C|nr:prepilin-type N-terminal cleavage/methylation domain-containing protein [Actinotalea sp. C106]